MRNLQLTCGGGPDFWGSEEGKKHQLPKKNIANGKPDNAYRYVEIDIIFETTRFELVGGWRDHTRRLAKINISRHSATNPKAPAAAVSWKQSQKGTMGVRINTHRPDVRAPYSSHFVRGSYEKQKVNPVRGGRCTGPVFSPRST